jgi:hypothetical protein
MTVEVTRLPSGLTVATETMPTIETAAVQVWAHAGSRLERPEESGIAHVLGTAFKERPVDRSRSRKSSRRWFHSSAHQYRRHPRRTHAEG